MTGSNPRAQLKPGEKPKRPKKPRENYKQDTRLYNLAQAREPRDFLHLLRDLCGTIPDELFDQIFYREKGRPRVRLADVAFAMMFKVYFKLPGRKMGSTRDGGFLVELFEAGYISQPLHWNTVGHYLRDIRMSEVLEYLIETSALPLVPVERGEFETVILPLAKFDGGDISADSTVAAGASRTKKGSKKGYRGQREHKIIKVHLTTGNRTNIVPACAIDTPGAHESPILPGLIHTTGKSFKIGHVFGDRAYSTRRAYNAVDALGGQGWFRFKKIHKGRGRDAFARMFHWVESHTEEFFEKYFRRNNVEATFSAIFRVLLHGLRHKTATLRSKKAESSMKNEFYAAVVAHNLRVVIRFMYLVGINAEFLPKSQNRVGSQSSYPRLPDEHRPSA